MAQRRKKSVSMAGMFLEMAVIIGLVVLLSTLLWNQLKPAKKPGKPILGGTTPPITTPSGLPGQTVDPLNTTSPGPTLPMGEQAIADYAAAHGLTVEDYQMGFDYYPEKLYDAYEKSPEARDFILRAPLEYNKTHEKDMSEFENVEGVPLFMQWDDRWGYTKYAYGLGGITGCGPTCLSMVVYYYTKDPTYTPDYMMKFAEENNYIGNEIDENGKLTGGTEWYLFDQGGEKLGFTVKRVPLDEGVLTRYLKAGTPVIVHLKECKFTYNGHYIVLTGYENGRITVNDPNSRALSAEGCTYDEIENAIRNMWVFTPKQQQ